jgi:ABC-type polysaccharide/polyol phosphate export permease
VTSTVTGTTSSRGGFWQYRALILNFARRDLRARFKGTLLGLAWSLVLPIATLATYSIVFGIIFKQKAPTLGNGENGPFPVFLFSGLVPWTMYAVTLGTAIASLLGNGPLMKKIYFPPYASVFGTVLATFYQSLIELAILAIALLVLANVGWTWILFLGWFALFASFVAALSLWFSVMNVYFRDTTHIVGIILQIQFYLTPIIYPITLVPGVWHRLPLRTVIELQPMAAFVETFRALVYGLEVGPARAWLTVCAWTAVSIAGAWIYYRRRGLDLSEEL